MGGLGVRLGYTLSPGQIAGSCVISFELIVRAVLARVDPGNFTVALKFSTTLGGYKDFVWLPGATWEPRIEEGSPQLGRVISTLSQERTNVSSIPLLRSHTRWTCA
jgi:hypothetical protein